MREVFDRRVCVASLVTLVSLSTLVALVLVIVPATGCESGAPPAKRRHYVPPTKGPKGLTKEQWGELIFRDHGCLACHSVTGVRGVGGALDHIWGVERTLEDGTTLDVDEAYLRESILEPSAKIHRGFDDDMPAYRGRLSDAQVDALIAFIEANS